MTQQSWRICPFDADHRADRVYLGNAVVLIVDEPGAGSVLRLERRAASGMRAMTSITVRVPMAIRRRGGRKPVVTQDGAKSGATQPTRIDSSLIAVLARAHVTGVTVFGLEFFQHRDVE